MDKNSILLVLLVLQLMATFTSTAHHEVSDLGAAAFSFFDGFSPVKANVVQMPEPDHEHSDNEDVTGNDVVEIGMNEEDTDGEDQLGDARNLFEDRFDGIDSDNDVDLLNDVDLMDMDLDKHIQMHQGHHSDEHLSTDVGINDEIIMDVNHMDSMASTKTQFPSIQKMPAQETNQYPTYRTTYAPQANDEYSKYMKTAYTYGPQENVYSTYQTTSTYAPQANKYSSYETTSTVYAPQANKKYSAYKTTTHDGYGTSMYRQGDDEHQISKARYAPVAHWHQKNNYKPNHGQYRNRYPVRYVPTIHVQKKNDYKRHAQYNRYPKKHLGTQSSYYQALSF